MHEMGIANSVIEGVRREMRRYPASVASKVGVKIGELTAIDPEALRFCFEAMLRDTDLAGLRLEIEICPRRHRCRACGNQFVVENYEFRCPLCGNAESECVSGDELELAYIEVEDHEPSAVGEKSSQ
ncbi:MAG TPA: hydrogenase maturation nickel metallochaperone HypA [Terriglobales bacterium]|nr:hydrogenase maturation nickel metallochaperone HypA [Terriglobales bacterium]